jgi:hypothetical protein
LEEVRKSKIKVKKMQQGMAKDMDALMELARMRGIKNAYWWAKMVLDNRKGKRKRA